MSSTAVNTLLGEMVGSRVFGRTKRVKRCGEGEGEGEGEEEEGEEEGVRGKGGEGEGQISSKTSTV